VASRPIQGYPVGFLSLLGLKNLGKLPDTLPDQVLAAFEMGPYYLRGLREIVEPGVAAVATGGYQSVNVMATPVPDGEVWFVHSFSLRFQAAAPPATGLYWGEVRIVHNLFSRWGEVKSTTNAGTLGEGIINIVDQWMFPGDFINTAWFMGVGDLIQRSPVYATRLVT